MVVLFHHNLGQNCGGIARPFCILSLPIWITGDFDEEGDMSMCTVKTMTRIWLRENKLIWYLLNTRNRIFSILLIIIIFFFSFSFFLLNNMYTAMFPICYLLWSNNTKPSYQISPFHGWHTRETTWLFTAHFYTVLVIYIERGCWLNNLKIWLFNCSEHTHTAWAKKHT